MRQIDTTPDMGASAAAGEGAAEASVPDIFSQLYQAEYRSQVRRAYLITGSSAAAGDIVADAFLALFNRWDSVAEPALYLNRCVVNGCRDWGRRQTRWSKLVRSVDPSSLDGSDGHDKKSKPDIARTTIGVANMIDEGFESVDLFDALGRLPHRQRAAIVLRFYGRESERSIAEVLGCRPGTVGSLIHRGLARLRKDLQ